MIFQITDTSTMKELNQPILNQLQDLLPSQFRYVVYEFKMPEHLLSRNASQTEQAIELIRYAQQYQNGEYHLQRIIRHSKESKLSLKSETLKVELDIHIHELDNPILKNIIKELQNLGRDVSLRIIGIEKGSVILLIRGSIKGCMTIISLFKSGEIKRISGINILNIQLYMYIEIYPNYSSWILLCIFLSPALFFMGYAHGIHTGIAAIMLEIILVLSLGDSWVKKHRIILEDEAVILTWHSRIKYKDISKFEIIKQKIVFGRITITGCRFYLHNGRVVKINPYMLGDGLKVIISVCKMNYIPINEMEINIF